MYSVNDKISKGRIEGAITILGHSGHDGVRIKFVPNPDAMVKDPVIVLTDIQGTEI
jgi:hypothetical protein